jgi:hypothetical protein
MVLEPPPLGLKISRRLVGIFVAFRRVRDGRRRHLSNEQAEEGDVEHIVLLSL